MTPPTLTRAEFERIADSVNPNSPNNQYVCDVVHAVAECDSCDLIRVLPAARKAFDALAAWLRFVDDHKPWFTEENCHDADTLLAQTQASLPPDWKEGGVNG